MTKFYLVLIIIFSFSCSTPEYKICDFQTNDPELKLYHDILTELIEQHFYSIYLRKVSAELDSKYSVIIDPADTAAFRKDLILLQNKLFGDTSNFETICYRPNLRSGPWNYFSSNPTDFLTLVKSDTTEYMREIKTFLTSFSLNWESVANTIAKSQTNYNGEDFKLCTSKVIPYRQLNECGIGVVSFSKVFLNEDKTSGLLYYEFTCGGKCGMGEVILVQYINKRWKIKDTMQLWIS